MKREILDGNTAAAKASYKLSDISFIYPITPSSTMAEVFEELFATKQKNIFGNVATVHQMQSEGGSIGAVHGATLNGSLATTFTSSQGLLLMIPNMYKIAGEMLPVVINVASRSVASHALNIFCDHSDVMSARQTGFAMLCSASVQEAHDFAIASHLAAAKTSIPFLHFFDGFRTSHEVCNIFTFEDEELKKLYPFESLMQFKNNCLSANKPFQAGTTEGTDVFFQGREKSNANYKNLPSALQQTFDQMSKISGRTYKPFEYYGSKTAKYVVVVMGSGFYAAKSVLQAANSADFGIVKVNLYRPFDSKLFVDVLPKTVQKIAVLDRTKEQGSVGEPLCADVCTSLNKHGKNVQVFGGRYGLGGKEFDASMAYAVFENLQNKNTKNNFTVGIDDDVFGTSLSCNKKFADNTLHTAIFWGFGSDGTVSATKNIAKIAGQNSKTNVQAYFLYDSKKSGSLTRSFLRIDNKPIEKPFLIENADVFVCNNTSFLHKHKIDKHLKQNGTLLLNCKFKSQTDLEQNLPNYLLKALSKKNITTYCIDANQIAMLHNIGGKTSAIMQLAYLGICGIVDFELAKHQTAEQIKTTLAKKGDEVVQNNIRALQDVQKAIVKIDHRQEWSNLKDDFEKPSDYIQQVLALDGDNIPVSHVNCFGKTQTGTSNLEKRNVAQQIPCWQNQNCLQCGKCAMICPHSVIRAKILTDEQLKTAPQNFKSNKCNFDKQNNFVLEISPMDCTGCGLCEKVCPAKQKAIVLKDKQDVLEQQLKSYNFSKDMQGTLPNLPLSTTKAQFMQPYFEFSGACAGCGETPYIRLLTQLFGNHLLIANATGCSSIYGGSNPTCPYTKNADGQGPAWANSLFEDNAEFGFGIAKSQNAKRQNLLQFVNQNLQNFEQLAKQQLEVWIENFDNQQVCNQIYLNLKNTKQQNLDAAQNNSKTCFDATSQLYDNLDGISKQSVWIVGGDGWAYDIDFGGLDHVLGSGENINILVLDTELYSNTGGQTSKASHISSTQKFATNGKQTNKKQLALMAMTYKDVYVAQVCLGADSNQTIKAMIEAQNHNGVSLIIAYCPCINHGSKTDTLSSQINAVKSGYWHMFRFNPALKQQNKNPLVLDSAPPSQPIDMFLQDQRRYANSIEKDKNAAQKIKQHQDEFYEILKKLSTL